jgi:two-component system NtrC family sensor kinase
MWQERIQRYLLPGKIENDPGFRQEIERLSHIALLVVGGVEVVVTAFMVVSHLLLDPSVEMAPHRVLMGACIVLCGLVTLALARVPRLYPYSRFLASASGLVAAGFLTWFLLRMTQFDPTADDFVPGNITLIMLVAVGAIPLRPTDTLVFGFVLEAIYVAVAYSLDVLLNVGTGVEPLYVLFIFVLTCLAAALTAVLYHQRRSTYEWHVSTLQAAENLRQAESRNLLAQNAASVGRLAAALSHEINTPLGALISGVDTLLLLASRQATVPPNEQQRLVVLQNELRKSIRESTDRLRTLVARMQRFTNLDKAEVQSANINDIIADVTAIVEPVFKGRAEIELKLEPVPELICRPQQLSAVFSNLLGNAVEATNGSGRVVISSRQKELLVEVEIEDTGHGLAPEQVECIFDPGFKVVEGRVSTGNWNMFSSRQIIREHGGDIAIESEPGRGTRVSVTLPVSGDRGLVRPT